MKKCNFIAAACVLILAGCQHFSHEARLGLEGFNPRVVRQPQPLFPNVFITSGGNIVVDQEPIRIPKGDERRLTISWALAAGSPYTFPSNGIEIREATKKVFDCRVQGELSKVLNCSFDRPPSGTVFKYTIRVRGPKEPPLLDPTIMIE